MQTNNFWVDLTISKIIGEDPSQTVIGLLNIAILRDTLDFLIYDLPFFCFLVGLGIVLLIISLFGKIH